MRKNIPRRSQIWISAVLYILIAAFVMVIVLEAGLPLLEGMRDRAVFQKTKDSMIIIDQHIRDIADEGMGSQRSVPIEIREGELSIKDNRLKWEMDSKSKILEPRTSVEMGNVILASNADVVSLEYSDWYTLENSRIFVNITRNGTVENLSKIVTGDLINQVKLKDTGTVLSGKFSFLVGPASCGTAGFGYTELLPAGNSTLSGDAEVIVHMNPNATSCSYDLELILEAQTDFLRVDVKNFRP